MKTPKDRNIKPHEGLASEQYAHRTYLHTGPELFCRLVTTVGGPWHMLRYYDAGASVYVVHLEGRVPYKVKGYQKTGANQSLLTRAEQ